MRLSVTSITRFLTSGTRNMKFKHYDYFMCNYFPSSFTFFSSSSFSFFLCWLRAHNEEKVSFTLQRPHSRWSSSFRAILYFSLFFLASTLIASPQQWSNIMNIDGVRKTQFWWTAAMMLDEHTKGRQKRETFATTLNGNSALATIELLLHYRQATYINLALLIYARIAYTTRHTCDDEMT